MSFKVVREPMERIDQYFVENEYLVSKMPTVTKIEEVLEHYRLLSEWLEAHPDIKVLIDCRETDFEFNPRNIGKIVEAVQHCLSMSDSIKEAILVAKPYETAIASLFEKRVPQNEHYQFNVFSTHEAALLWLL